MQWGEGQSPIAAHLYATLAVLPGRPGEMGPFGVVSGDAPTNTYEGRPKKWWRRDEIVLVINHGQSGVGGVGVLYPDV
ncbi:MAG: hypothetical protein JSU59_07785 [Nitrospirota bacterium]|nr:MAG: hypothetical protein JSU59_07785 [Nitrospirota bacterium]